MLSLQEFKQIASTKKIVSNWIELLADLDTPVGIYAKLRAKSQDAFLFESVVAGERIGRYSLIGYKALERFSCFKENTNPYDLLEKRLSELSDTTIPQLPFFHQGFVGFFSFESSAAVEPTLNLRANKYPDLSLLLVGSLVVFDHVKQKIYLIQNILIDPKLSLETQYQSSIEGIEELERIVLEKSSLPRLDLGAVNELDFKSNTGKEKFFTMVNKAKQHILDGDVFQIVLSHKLTAEIDSDPLQLYRILRTVNPSPYLFIYNVPDYDFTLVGSSPEMLAKTFRADDNSIWAEIRPIAGTYKRSNCSQEDGLLEEKLLADPKEMAEHVMLVDLARNDLGRVCENGTVTVPQQANIEKYSHVMHIVSSVIGKLAKTKSGIGLLKACFPAGTLSGAPKVEAIKIISQLEVETRGPYGGTIGYFALDGMMDTAIMIRTLVVEQNQVTIQAGAGIVADSSPESEWQETYNKANALIAVAKQASNT